MAFDFSRALLWMLLFPLAGALINGTLGRRAPRPWVEAIGIGSVGLALVMALICFVRLVLAPEPVADAAAKIVYQGYEWFAVNIGEQRVSVPLGLVFDALSAVMCLVVTGVGLVIHIYAASYMREDPTPARFFAAMNLFIAAMLLLVLASSLPLMFIGWEGVGLCSYLLIGYWYRRPAFTGAAKKAFLVNRIGDVGLLLAMLILVDSAHSWDFGTIASAVPELARPLFIGDFELGRTATVVALLIFWGCAGKSAQLPLHVWLPDAMVGPTPVSALIHAATMVTAGVYLCCRTAALWMSAPTALLVVACVGAATAVMAAVLACVQNGLKRVLAYSTISQLGLMFVGIGCGAFGASLLHVLTHAFFKACLFLGAGAIMVAVHAHDDADLRKLGGLRRALPLTHATFAVAALSLAGVPGTSGFFSKDAIFAAVWNHPPEAAGDWLGTALFASVLLTAALTAFYIFRAYFMVFASRPQPIVGSHSRRPEAADTAIPSLNRLPTGMAVGLAVTAIGAIVAGWLHGSALHLPWDVWTSWLAPIWPDVASASAIGVSVASEANGHTAALLGGTAAAAIGLCCAYANYRASLRTPRPELGLRLATKIADAAEGFGLDRLYAIGVVRPARTVATLAAGIDYTFIDALLVRASSLTVRLGGWAALRLQTGSLYVYALAMAVGMLGAVAWVLYPHPSVTVRAERGVLVLQAGRGLGYRYRWDLNADGNFDTESSAVAHRIELKGPSRATLEVRNVFGHVATTSIDARLPDTGVSP